MNKEQQELVDEAYKNFKGQIEHGLNSMFLVNDGPNKITPLTQEEFINTCKTYPELTWGLKIEERELSLEERFEYSHNVRGLYYLNKTREQIEEDLNYENIPTKLITTTYNDKTIESYE